MKFHRKAAGFTLVEVIVASGIVVVIMGVLLTMTDQTQRLVKTTSAKIEQFQDARVGFESLTRRLSQATLNAFWDYDYDTNGNPKGYQRAAELRFRSGQMKVLNPEGGPDGNLQPSHGVFFQTPNGLVEDINKLGSLDHLINTWGYFVEIGSDAASLPAFLQGKVDARKRYRLMEFMQPSEKLTVYTNAGQIPGTSTGWFAKELRGANRPARVLTENVVALIVLPRLSLADEEQWKKDTGKAVAPSLAPGDYSYNSTDPGRNAKDAVLNTKNQLPPVVQIIMVAIDENSARMLEDRYGSNAYLGIENYESRFKDPAALADVGRKPGDLSSFENSLIAKKVSYRTFSTNVSIRGAKWSRSQTN